MDVALAAPPAPWSTLAPVSAPEQRILDAALRCIARWGMGKTTLDDVAREAGYSRATVYRIFPGGKEGLIEAVVCREIQRFFTAVTARMAVADDLEGALVGGVVEAAGRIQSHPALQFLLAHEPETVLPRLAFTAMDEVLAVATAVTAPQLTRFLDPDAAERTAEWVTRIVLSYSSCPADGVDLADERSARNLVRSFVLPGLLTTTNP